jgi:hypothetical protein
MTIEAPTSHYEDSEDDHHIGVEFVNVTDQEDHGVNQKTNVVTNVEQLITFLSFLFPPLVWWAEWRLFSFWYPSISRVG